MEFLSWSLLSFACSLFCVIIPSSVLGLRCEVTGPDGPQVNVPCVFPFRFRSKTYTECTTDTDPAGKSWCSTVVDEHGVHVGGGLGNWGYCDPGCSEGGTTDEEATSSASNDGGSPSTATTTTSAAAGASTSESGSWLPRPDKQECGFRTDVGFIVGGTHSSRGQFPFVALLGYRQQQSGKLLYKCGGTLINRRYVLTAAHCHVDFPKEMSIQEVVLGEFDVGLDPDCAGCKKASRFQVSEGDVTKHENWNPGQQYTGNDIALIRLSSLATTIAEDPNQVIVPICLAWRGEAAPTKQLVVVGWGKTSNKEKSDVESKYGVYQRTMLKLSVPLVDTAKCEEIYDKKLSPNYICAGGERNKDSCGGDSGGPLISREGNEKPMYLLGIVSFGVDDCGTEGYPGVYTNIEHQIPWIRANLQP